MNFILLLNTYSQYSTKESLWRNDKSKQIRINIYLIRSVINWLDRNGSFCQIITLTQYFLPAYAGCFHSSDWLHLLSDRRISLIYHLVGDWQSHAPFPIVCSRRRQSKILQPVHLNSVWHQLRICENRTTVIPWYHLEWCVISHSHAATGFVHSEEHIVSFCEIW